jgi:sulfonate transport system ATP-binding protein
MNAVTASPGEWPVALARPRRRDDPSFGPLVRTVLDAVMTPSRPE